MTLLTVEAIGEQKVQFIPHMEAPFNFDEWEC